MANFHKKRRNYPLGFAFLPDKTTQTYVQIWSAISAFVQEPPRAIHVNFESVDLKALKEIFRNSAIEGCWFQFWCAIWQNLQAKSLSTMPTGPFSCMSKAFYPGLCAYWSGGWIFWDIKCQQAGSQSERDRQAWALLWGHLPWPKVGKPWSMKACQVPSTN